MANKIISIGRIINYCSFGWSDGTGAKGATAAFSAATASAIGAVGESGSGAAFKWKGKYNWNCNYI